MGEKENFNPIKAAKQLRAYCKGRANCHLCLFTNGKIEDNCLLVLGRYPYNWELPQEEEDGKQMD